MTTIKSFTTLLLAATLVGLAGCGQQDNTGQTDDSGMSDTAPGTTGGDTSGSASDPYATQPGQSDDTMTAPQSDDMGGQGAGGATDPNATDPNATGTSGDTSTGTQQDPSMQGGATEEGSPPPAQ